MSEAETTPAPRRSHREKRQNQQYNVGAKRKRVDEDTDAEDDVTGIELGAGERAEGDAEDDYVAPWKPKKSTRGRGKARGQMSPRKPRAPKAAAKTSTRRPRKVNGEVAKSSQRITGDAKIANDNALFNALMNPNAALQSVVEDLLDSYSQSPQATQADIINCILRCCGSNDSVDADRAVDHDGIVDALDDFTEVLKEDEAPTYPLTSKLPIFKKFRKSLSEFLNRLIASSAELGSLYSTELLTTIQAWVVAMSSSQLRSFRHTATMIALEIETALCEVAAAVEKEAEVITRQREAEKKRKGRGASSSRDKEFEQKAAEVKGRRSSLAEYLKDIFDGVFVHRYRDLDPNIRAECVHALGDWLKKFPAHFLSGNYLRYVGWVLTDKNTHVRHEAVKSLVSLYNKDDYIVSLQSFTERFKPRLVEMATRDMELSVRVSVIQVLGAIDTHGLLDEEQRAELCLLVFDADAKVRRAVSRFVHGVWKETVEQRLVGKARPTETEKNRAGLKSLSKLLVEWSRTLDRRTAGATVEEGDGEASSQEDSSSTAREFAHVLSAQQKGRVALAVEALWDEVSSVSDWEALLDLLLLDHSARAVTNGDTPVSRRKKTKKPTDDAMVDEAWRLEEVEEAVLLEVLVAALRKSIAEAAAGKKGEEDGVSSEITRALIKSLPDLFAKHQTDEGRIAIVLQIPELMTLDMFLEMRMVTAYESLWDDVLKQFLSHSSPAVLSHAISTISHLMAATSLSNTNGTKILELEDELATSLRDVVAGRDELEVATFSEDEALRLGAICARLAALEGVRDMTAWMEEDEGGKQSSAWDIVSALAERGRLGYKEEETMVDRALHVLTLHVIWKARNLLHLQAEEEAFREILREQRDSLVEKLVEYAIGNQSNTLLSIKRTAFQNLMTLHILFASSATEDAEGNPRPLASLAISMSDEVQYRCAGFVQAEIERFADELESDKPHKEKEADSDGSGSSSESEPDLDTAAKKAKSRAGKGKKGKNAEEGEPDEVASRVRLEEEYIFNTTVATFLRAIRAGVIHVRHCAVLLAHYGRLGHAFDLTAKLMVDILREEGMYKDDGDLVVEVITQSMKESFTLFLDGVANSEQYTLSLAKLLRSCLVIRGAQLTIVKRLPSEYVVKTHSSLVTWIVKRVAAYDAVQNKKLRRKALLFFRVLAQLVIALETRDALTIKAHLDQDIALSRMEIPQTSKAWEPYRAYEKRLASAISKEKGGKGKKGKRKEQAAEYVTTDDDEEGEVQGLVEPNGQSSQPAPPPPPRPQPRPAYLRQRTPSPRPENGVSDNESRLTEEPDDEAVRTNGAEDVAASSREPSPQTQSQAHTPRRNSDMANGVTPISSPSKKRARPPADVDTDLRDNRAAASQVQDADEDDGQIIVRRKRVRH